MIMSPVTELVEEIRQGRMIIMMDDEDRENEGDLIVAAEKVTPDIINFMCIHARGLICMPLAASLCDRLELPLMVARGEDAHGTAFTVSIEAARGVTTGISAADRARTVQVAIDPRSRASDLVRPGHIFPLRANPGGVLKRAGHTEAGVELAGLAGLAPGAVVVEIMRDDGTMARRADLELFAARHGLKMGTLADLVAYVKHDQNALQREKTL